MNFKLLAENCVEHLKEIYTKKCKKIMFKSTTFFVQCHVITDKNVTTELFNSKNEWHQPEIMSTTILQGGVR